MKGPNGQPSRGDRQKGKIEMSELLKAAAALGRKGGKVKTAAKSEAARENGRKGGRPKGSRKKKKEYDLAIC